MNLRSLSPEQSRKLALGILVGVVVAVVAAVAIPVWLVHRHYDTALADMTDKLERYRRIADHAARSRSQPRGGAREGIAQVLPAPGRRRALGGRGAGGGALDGRGQRRAPHHDAGAGREGRGALPPGPRERAAHRQHPGAAQDPAPRSRPATPLLFIDNLMVRSQVPATFRPGPGAEPEMFVQFDVYGYSADGDLMPDFLQRNPLVARARRVRRGAARGASASRPAGAPACALRWRPRSREGCRRRCEAAAAAGRGRARAGLSRDRRAAALHAHAPSRARCGSGRLAW